MEKFYDYSVKECLSKMFTEDTVLQMRSYEKDRETDRGVLIPLAWTYADGMAVDHFLTNYFLVDTVIYDDYIAYFTKEKNGDTVFLSFMSFYGEHPFDLDPEYAYRLVEEWKAKGQKALIMMNRVKVEDCWNGEYQFVNYRGDSEFMEPVYIDGRYVFVKVSDPFWNHATGFAYRAITGGLMRDYECVFADDVVLERCTWKFDPNISNNEHTEVVARGIKDVKEYFDGKKDVAVAYTKRKEDAAFMIGLIADEYKYVLFVGAKNQIMRIVGEKLRYYGEVIRLPSERIPETVPMPKITGVNPIDPEATRAYGVQIVCDNGNVRNYYMKAFDTADIPEKTEVDGFVFDRGTLGSAKIVMKVQTEGVLFENGYFIPSYLLYYRGISQLVPEKMNGVARRVGGTVILGKYRKPRRVRGILNSTYEPRGDEYYGPQEALTDRDGNRISDCSGYFSGVSEVDDNVRFIKSVPEANRKIGYMNPDGTWLVPPIFTKAEPFFENCCAAAEIGDRKYIVNKAGEVIPFEYHIETYMFFCGLCPFRVEEFDGKITYPEEGNFDELSPGLWGYIDETGRTAIEPQFVFATRFGLVNGERAFVARLVDGEPKWGLIDAKGNEIIECKYPNLSTHFGTAVNFQLEKNGPYGIMDTDGNVLMEPRYPSIHQYDEKHGLIAAYDGNGLVGVADIATGKIIVPFEYQYVEFKRDYIVCEKEFDPETLCLYPEVPDFYNYSGNPLPADIYANSWETDIGIYKWKNDKLGVIDKNGNTVVPFFDEPIFIDYYLKGFCVTGVKGRYGLSEISGKVILEEKYSRIEIEDGFVIASQGGASLLYLTDELYLTDGTKVFDDISRRIDIKGNVLTRETPSGKEFYEIVKKDGR